MKLFMLASLMVKLWRLLVKFSRRLLVSARLLMFLKLRLMPSRLSFVKLRLPLMFTLAVLLLLVKLPRRRPSSVGAPVIPLRMLRPGCPRSRRHRRPRKRRLGTLPARHRSSARDPGSAAHNPGSHCGGFRPLEGALRLAAGGRGGGAATGWMRRFIRIRFRMTGCCWRHRCRRRFWTDRFANVRQAGHGSPPASGRRVASILAPVACQFA